jgi:hypothetical protein
MPRWLKTTLKVSKVRPMKFSKEKMIYTTKIESKIFKEEKD